MSESATRTISTAYPVALSPASLTVHKPPQVKSSGATSAYPDPPAKLKIKLLPYVNISSPPFPQAAYGRKIEQIADIIMQVGGKVNINLDVNVVGLDFAEEHVEGAARSEYGKERSGSWNKEEVAMRVKFAVECIFEAVRPWSLHLWVLFKRSLDRNMLRRGDSDGKNRDKLAIARLSVSDQGDVIVIAPLISVPSRSSALDLLCVTGNPSASLVDLNISLSWHAIEQKVHDKEGSQGGYAELDPTPQERESQSDDMLLLDDHDLDEECDLGSNLDLDLDLDFDPDLDGDPDLSQGPRPESLDCLTTTGSATGRDDKPYGWIYKQLEWGIHKLIKLHLIKRFPLIFDGALIQHALTLHPHRSLVSSFARFLQLSKDNERDFFNSAVAGISNISNVQGEHMLAHVTAAASVPHRSRGPGIAPKSKVRKKRKTGSHPQSQSQGSGDSQEADDPVQQRIDAHLTDPFARLEEEDGDGVERNVKVLERLLKQGMGAVGRAKWEMSRQGQGRMAAHRIKLHTKVEDVVATTDFGERERAQEEKMQNLFDLPAFVTELGESKVWSTVGTRDDNVGIAGSEDEKLSLLDFDWEEGDDAGQLSLDSKEELGLGLNMDIDLRSDHPVDQALSRTVASRNGWRYAGDPPDIAEKHADGLLDEDIGMGHNGSLDFTLETDWKDSYETGTHCTRADAAIDESLAEDTEYLLGLRDTTRFLGSEDVPDRREPGPEANAEDIGTEVDLLPQEQPFPENEQVLENAEPSGFDPIMHPEDLDWEYQMMEMDEEDIYKRWLEDGEGRW